MAHSSTLLAAAFFLLAASRTGIAADSSPRSVESFDRGWRFHLGDATGADAAAFDDSTWRALDLPHDWSVEGPPNVDPAKRGAQEGPFDPNSPAGPGGAYLNGGVGWYRKTFPVPDSDKGKRVMILFDGAYENADVSVNGHALGHHPYGFTSFFYDLTPELNFGATPNVVAVRLEADQPGCRWYSGAGLYRHVWLITTGPVHLAQWGTFVTTPKAEANGAEVKAATTVQNDGTTAASAVLTTILRDPDGREVGRQESTQAVAAGKAISFDQTMDLATAQLWSCESPRLYHAVSEVRVGGRLVDATETAFGIRTIEFTKDKGFFLNGRHVAIQGVCNHHDLGCLGSAAYRRAIERQLEILKSFGCNAVRTSHNPPSPELLELCDRMGILVMDEAFDEWTEDHNRYGYAENFEKWSEPDLVSMLDRDRNHPSIILWSIGNEIPEGNEGKPIAGVIAHRLVGICHREDPTRPVTSACPAPSNAWSSGLAQALDVFGVNYALGWYAKNDPAAAPAPSGSPDYHGQLPMIGSETASQVDSRGEYGLGVGPQGEVENAILAHTQVFAYDFWHPGWSYSAETDLLALKNAPWMAGEFAWTGFDYLGEPTPYGWPARSSYFGIVDLCGFPKDRYYLYKSQWRSEPLVHILPMNWNWPALQGKPVPVRVCTNADSVELFLNGKSLGVKNFPADCESQTAILEKGKEKSLVALHSPGLMLAWSVPYAPGELKAVATKNGAIVATDMVRTAGTPARIRVTPDRETIAGDGQDLSFVTVTMVDKDGNVCPTADEEITFGVDGAGASLIGLDNGDPTNHESFQGTQHKAFHGLALAVLRSKYKKSGAVKVTASAAGLAPGTATVTVAAP